MSPLVLTLSSSPAGERLTPQALTGKKDGSLRSSVGCQYSKSCFRQMKEGRRRAPGAGRREGQLVSEGRSGFAG